MYDKIVGDIKEKLASLKKRYGWNEEAIVNVKKELADLYKGREELTTKIEQYELLLIEMGVDPNEEATK